MPWPAVKFDEEDVRQALGERFNVQGIPRLVIVGKDGKTLVEDARQAVTAEKEGAILKYL